MENKKRINHTGERYVTRGLNAELDPFIKMALWNFISKLGSDRDYLQVFELENEGMNLKITHRQEYPEYEKKYILTNTNLEENMKIFVIDDGCYSTMMLASEY